MSRRRLVWDVSELGPHAAHTDEAERKRDDRQTQASRLPHTEGIGSMKMDSKGVMKAAKCGMWLALGTAGAGVLAMPVPAFAAGQWKVNDMLNSAGKQAGVQPTTVTAGTITDWVNKIVSWAIGIAVTFFVLRIALTAFDRMVLANSNTTAHVPFAYPNPGDERYDPNDLDGKQPPEGWTWKRILINFAKQLALVAGAWAIVQLIMGIVQMFMSNTIQGS